MDLNLQTYSRAHLRKSANSFAKVSLQSFVQLSGKRAVHGGVICRWKRKAAVIRIVSEVWITGAVKEEGFIRRPWRLSEARLL